MKKLLNVLLCAILALSACALVACKPDDGGNQTPTSIKVVMPDGAPALAMAQLMDENMQFGEDVNYKVVEASNIKNFVTGSGEKADVALLPVNLASMLLGQGNEYKMIATITHGNLYLLSKNATAITLDNAVSTLKGKTIAVVNLPAVPGLTTKAMLNKLGVEFTMDESQKSENNVFLKGIAGTEIATSLNSAENPVDYVVAPEPAVSTITGKAPVIKKVGALHEIYGRYPQAVMVAKSSLLEENKKLVVDIFDAMVANQQWIKDNPAKAAEAVKNCLPEGVTPSFNAQNTTLASVSGSGIDVVSMTESAIAEVNGYISSIIPLGGASPVAKTFSQDFFVNIKQ